MGEVINLRLVRKRRARATAATQAEANRRKFGRTILEKRAEATATARHEHTLDSARVEGQDDD
jgi:hypothetical protein